MIPKIENIQIGEEIEIVEEPTFTWKIDFENKRVIGYTDEIEAMKQAIYLILNTERYRHEIYDWNYGIELSDLFGKDKAYAYPELKRRIREALIADDRITDVTDFEFELARFTVNTVFGDTEASREVNI